MLHDYLHTTLFEILEPSTLGRNVEVPATMVVERGIRKDVGKGMKDETILVGVMSRES